MHAGVLIVRKESTCVLGGIVNRHRHAVCNRREGQVIRWDWNPTTMSATQMIGSTWVSRRADHAHTINTMYTILTSLRVYKQ